MVIILAVLLAFISMMVAALGALIGMAVAVFFDLPAMICVPAGAVAAILGAVVLERQAPKIGQSVRKHRL
ncbi:MAG: hypothetical protein ABI240_05795 [Sphingomonas sp.]